ncbi:hypothetical protein BD779DRAFT_1561621 [Infundibulicybe gibba]|nr:hypothetical protein BD779DRAFT_1561621 [Infundibulicybe gibba]
MRMGREWNWPQCSLTVVLILKSTILRPVALTLIDSYRISHTMRFGHHYAISQGAGSFSKVLSHWRSLGATVPRTGLGLEECLSEIKVVHSRPRSP